VLEQRPGRTRDQLHHRLVSLDLGEHITNRDGVAFLLFPLYQPALLHSGGEGFHYHVRGHS
jgi:hypothetical protein